MQDKKIKLYTDIKENSDDKTYCFIDPKDMVKIVKKALNKGFNRTIPLDIVKSFKNAKCLVFLTMLHEHIKGEKVDPHYRICFYASTTKEMKPDMYILDVDIDIFDNYAKYQEI